MPRISSIHRCKQCVDCGFSEQHPGHFWHSTCCRCKLRLPSLRPRKESEHRALGSPTFGSGPEASKSKLVNSFLVFGSSCFFLGGGGESCFSKTTRFFFEGRLHMKSLERLSRYHRTWRCPEVVILLVSMCGHKDGPLWYQEAHFPPSFGSQTLLEPRVSQ